MIENQITGSETLNRPSINNSNYQTNMSHGAEEIKSSDMKNSKNSTLKGETSTGDSNYTDKDSANKQFFKNSNFL